MKRAPLLRAARISNIRNILTEAAFQCLAAAAFLVVFLPPDKAVSVAHADLLGSWGFSGINAAGTVPVGSLAPTTTAANLGVGNLLLGPGIAASNTDSTFGANSWDEKTNSLDAANGGDYLTLSFTANTGFTESFSSVSAYNVRRSNTGPTTGIWQYQIGAGSFIDIGSDITWGTGVAPGGNPQVAIDLTGISDLQNVANGTTVTFRIVNWGDSGSGGTWYFNGSGTDGGSLTINGSVGIGSSATLLFWAGDSAHFGGSGIWDQSTHNTWSTSNGVVSPTLWDSNKTAIFGGTTAGMVAVNGTVNAAAGINFTTDGYQVNPGTAGKIVLSGANVTTNSISTDAAVTATINTVLDGTNGMTKGGGGNLILTANNTYTGGTAVTAGTLQVGNGSTSGSINGDVVTNATLKFSRSDTVTFAGNISGAGSLVQAGAGTLILTGDATQGGVTTVSSGTLQVGDGTFLGSLSSNVAIGSGATLAFNHSNTLIYPGSLSGAGALVQMGTGTLILTGTNSFTGGTTIAAGGTVQVGNGTTGTLSGDVMNSGTLTFSHTNNAFFAGNISGSGSLVQNGAARLTLTGNAAHTGGTTISTFADSIQVGNGGTIGSLAGDVTNNGVLIFNRSDSIAFAGSITGSGSVTQAGTGTLSLSGDNHYTFGATVSSGTLKAASNNALGEPTGIVTVTKGTLVGAAGLTIANPIKVTDTGAGTGGILAFWNFGNSTPGGGALGTFNTSGSTEVFDSVNKRLSIASAGVYASSATIDLSNLAGTMGGSANNNWGTFAGTTINETVAGENDTSLAVVGTGNNSNSVIYRLTTTGYGNLVASYATQRSGTGFDTQTWSYSTDGTNFTPLAAPVTGIQSSFTLTTVDLSSITDINDKPNIYLKVTFTGATSTSGNNRIDNVQFNAIPFEGSLVPNASVGSDITSGSVTYSGSVTVDNNVALTSAAGGTVNFTGALVDGAGPGTIVKTGAGTVVLFGNNTYTGNTFVQAGTLSLSTTSNNNIPNSSKIVVGDTAAHSSAVLNVSQVNTGGDGFHVVSGQTLGGHGSVVGPVTVDAGAFLAPGGSVGTLTASGVTLHGTLNIEINESSPSANDVLNVTGSLSLAGAALDVALTGNTGHAIYVISHYGSLAGSFTTTTGLPTGYSVDMNYLGTSQIALVSYIQGDFNRDGLVTGADIPAMLSALTDLNSYQSQNHLTNAQLLSIGDLGPSPDGVVNNKDIQRELDLVTSLGGGSLAAVPEPGSFVLLGLGALGMIALGCRSRRKNARKISLVYR